MAATNGGARTPATVTEADGGYRDSCAGGATQAAKSALVMTGAYARVRPHVWTIF
ncbi:hypothetical protein ACFV8Z_47065 [Streptomyces sp. NPDC059837]|uniref:hypothetical protein n=1 Tax=Streptomyces sp. NPDC059837 TaxID=3346968 RepID=UPI00364C8B1A